MRDSTPLPSPEHRSRLELPAESGAAGGRFHAGFLSECLLWGKLQPLKLFTSATAIASRVRPPQLFARHGSTPQTTACCPHHLTPRPAS